jgi:hypothetical protein
MGLIAVFDTKIACQVVRVALVGAVFGIGEIVYVPVSETRKRHLIADTVRADPTTHDSAVFHIRDMKDDVDFKGKGSRLPVKALNLDDSHEVILSRAKKRPCLVMDTVGEPNERVRAIHDRMPVILEPDSFNAWLDERATVPALRELLRPLPDSRQRLYRVSEHVNNPRHDDSACIHPLP